MGKQTLIHYFDCDLLTLFLAVPDFRSGMNTSLETGNIGIESISMSETAAMDYSLAMCVCILLTHMGIDSSTQVSPPLLPKSKSLDKVYCHPGGSTRIPIPMQVQENGSSKHTSRPGPASARPPMSPRPFLQPPI